MDRASKVVSLVRMKELLGEMDVVELVREQGSPLLLLDPARAAEQYRAVKTAIGGRAHYAAKALSHPAVFAAIVAEDGYFDVASPREVQMIVEAGIDGSRCIYTNPIKKPMDVAVAVAAGVRRFVFDTVSDLANYAGYEDEVKLLLRLSYRNPEALSDLSYKFGVEPSAASELLDAAKARDLIVDGLSFHPGSQLGTIAPLVNDITLSHSVMRLANKQGYDLRILDIGGGFPVAYNVPVPRMSDLAKQVNEALEPVRADGIEIWTEPGRFVAAPSMVCLTSVVGVAERGGEPWYYLDDGMYGSYSNIASDHVMPMFYAEKQLRFDADPDMALHASVLAGPTCDSADVMTTSAMLPELNVGDVIVSPMMGSYTMSTASDFNGIERARVVVL